MVDLLKCTPDFKPGEAGFESRNRSMSHDNTRLQIGCPQPFGGGFARPPVLDGEEHSRKAVEKQRAQHCVALSGFFDSDLKRASQPKQPGANCRNRLVFS
ncbi:MAG: hypothetical protein ABSF23_10315 [Terracidiphilus sp.]|jgi:hypothetical protein